MTDQPPDRPDRRERPRAEPEIIPPDRTGQSSYRQTSAVWISVGPDGRVHVAKPGFFSLLLLTLGIAFLVALILVVLFGAILVAVPVVILLLAAGVIFALWQRFLAPK
jgi:hypothetical protein